MPSDRCAPPISRSPARRSRACPSRRSAIPARFAAAPASCSAGGGTDIQTVVDFGANGIIGVGTTATDCGTFCASGGQSAAIYYDCPTTGCSAVIARASSASAPFEQLPNPVAAFPSDNNGVILSLPSVPENGASAVSGTVTFGIGTQADNALTATTVLPITTSASRLGPGLPHRHLQRQAAHAELPRQRQQQLFLHRHDPAAMHRPGSQCFLLPGRADCCCRRS